MKKKLIVSDIDSCGACSICSTVCSLVKDDECNPEKSRIKIVRGEMLEAICICQQCEILFCASVCARNAIRRDPVSGVILVDEDLCNGCRKCISACPYGAIAFHNENKKALICDHCDGDPQCVKWCPRSALDYGEVNDSNNKVRVINAEKTLSAIHKIGG